MNEDQLNRLKSEGMSRKKLAEEITRIDHAIPTASRPREVKRYERRREIFAKELAFRIASGRD